MAVSSCLANRIVRDLAGQSGNVVLLFPRRRLMDADTEQSYEEGFTLPLRHGHGNLHLKALHLEAAKGKAGYDLSAFKQAMEQAQDALAVVSYAGAPAGFDTLFSPGNRKPPLSMSLTPKERPIGLARSRLAASGPWSCLGREWTRALGQAVAGMPGAIFERFYLLATPETAEQVAAQLSKQ